MNRNGRFLTTLLLGAWIAPAQAIPITFDLSGVLRDTIDWDTQANIQTYDPSRAGTAFSAQFVLETDLFPAPIASESDLNYRLSFRDVTGGAVLRSFNLGGVDLPLTPYASNPAVISVGDSKGLVCSETVGCRYSPDQWNLSMLSEQIDVPAQGANQRRIVTLGLSEPSLPGEFGGGDWFDFADGFDIGTIGTLSLEGINLNLSLVDYRIACAERCNSIGQVMNFFQVTSFTRTVGDVPEPGTLALMLVGLGGAAALRRRRMATN